MPEIKLSSDQLSLMSMFQGMTGATARDCVVDEKLLDVTPCPRSEVEASRYPMIANITIPPTR